MRALLLAAAALALGAGRCAGSSDEGSSARLGYLLVQKSYPTHDTYELDHQLIVRSEDPAIVMELLGLRPGMAVGDIGCGSGFYTTRMIEAVGASGRVFAIDVQQAAIDYLARRLGEEGLDPHGVVRLSLSRVDDSTLAPGVLDAALLSHADFYAFPELLPENTRMIADLYEAMRAGGALVVVQDMTILPELVAHYGDQGARTIAANFAVAGFRLEEQRGVPRQEVYMKFRKPAPERAGSGLPGH